MPSRTIETSAADRDALVEQLRAGRGASVEERLSLFDGFDTEDNYNRYQGRDLDVDPYELFAKLRRRGEIVRADVHEEFGLARNVSLTISATGYRDVPRDQIFSALGFNAVQEVLRSDGFDNSAHLRAHLPSLGKTLISMDGVEHRRHRALVALPFARKSMEAWTVPLVRKSADRSLQSFLQASPGPDGAVDLVSTFILDYPVRVIGAVLGFDETDAQTFKRAALAMITFADTELSSLAGEVLYSWIEELAVEKRLRRIETSLISQLAHAEVDGEMLDAGEIASFVRLLFVGGFDTTVKALGNLMLGLLTSGQYEDIVRTPALIPAAVEEGLRWETSVLGVPRISTRAQEVRGIGIAEGAAVFCFIAAANRDPDRWEHPDVFDLHREPKLSATFSAGAHTCIGAQLAKTELEIALAVLTSAYPHLELAWPEDGRSLIRGLASRGPSCLPVRSGR